MQEGMLSTLSCDRPAFFSLLPFSLRLRLLFRLDPIGSLLRVKLRCPWELKNKIMSRKFMHARIIGLGMVTDLVLIGSELGGAKVSASGPCSGQK